MKFFTLILLFLWTSTTLASDPLPTKHPGLRHLRETCYLPESFDQETFDSLWMVWPTELRNAASKMTREKRHLATMERYGLVADPESDEVKPYGYIVDPQGGWHMTCLTCHQGAVEGKLIPGVANQQFDLQSLTEDVATVKLFQGKLKRMGDIGALAFPMGSSSGTTNAVMFGVAFVAQRDADLRNISPRPVHYVHHDMDAPAWWHYGKKSGIYIDGFSPKYHRVLMQFSLVPTNSREQIYEWEPDFVEIEEYLESLTTPKYPGEIDPQLAQRGAAVFNEHCATCHGTYQTAYSDDKDSYPNRMVPIEEIGTDRVRYDSIGPEHREWIRDSWLSEYGKQRVTLDPPGYVAPPLDGIWASAPYFHNGSIPTLKDVLNPEHRPVVWNRTNNAYDHEKIGLMSETLEAVPRDVTDKVARRRYFDTRLPGKSNTGHDYPNSLNDEEKRAVLEYLKSL